MAKKHIVATLIVEIDEDQNACSCNQKAMEYIRSSLVLEPFGVLTDLRVMILGGENIPVPKTETRSEIVKRYLYKDYEVKITRAYYSKRRKDQPKYFATYSNTRVKTKTGYVLMGIGNISLKKFQSEIEQHVDKKALARERRENSAGGVGVRPII
jgi:hypothetical protein